ncbi:MAG TPA: hypothetical protein VEX18_06555, partial [Polyangiaceae bacterium]|nr:hypothetical protein [Polyangiaceae bacterium]
MPRTGASTRRDWPFAREGGAEPAGTAPGAGGLPAEALGGATSRAALVTTTGASVAEIAGAALSEVGVAS